MACSSPLTMYKRKSLLQEVKTLKHTKIYQVFWSTLIDKAATCALTVERIFNLQLFTATTAGQCILGFHF